MLVHVGNHHIWYTDLDFYHKTSVGLTVLAAMVTVAWCLYLGLVGRLVQLCLNTLIWAVPCMFDVCCLMSLEVALLDSSFLAICNTFAVGYCTRSDLCYLHLLFWQ